MRELVGFRADLNRLIDGEVEMLHPEASKHGDSALAIIVDDYSEIEDLIEKIVAVATRYGAQEG